MYWLSDIGDRARPFRSRGPESGDQPDRLVVDRIGSAHGLGQRLVPVADHTDSDTDPDQVSKLLTNLQDTGSANVGTADLSGFNTGAIKLTIRRFREFNQTIGLAEGTVRTEVVKEIALNLQ